MSSCHVVAEVQTVSFIDSFLLDHGQSLAGTKLVCDFRVAQKSRKKFQTEITHRKESIMMTNLRSIQAMIDRLAETSQQKGSISMTDSRNNQVGILTVWLEN